MSVSSHGDGTVTSLRRGIIRPTWTMHHKFWLRHLHREESSETTSCLPAAEIPLNVLFRVGEQNTKKRI